MAEAVFPSDKAPFAFKVGIRPPKFHHMPDAVILLKQGIRLNYFFSDSEVGAPVGANKPALHQQAVRQPRAQPRLRTLIKEDTVCTHSP